MKVIREKSREYNGKSYYKYKINIPEKILNESKISERDQLKAEVEEGKIIIIKNNN